LLSIVAKPVEFSSLTLGRKAPMGDQIAEVLRKLIISGGLTPGDRIVESRVARQLGVGQPTVREALVALEHQGLVIRKANQGCVVTSLTREEILQALRIRGELEILAVEMAVENASDEELSGLLAITERMKSAARAKKIEEFFDQDFKFHGALWKLSGNAFLPKLLAQLMLPLLAFLFLRNLRNHSHVNLEASANAHTDIVQGILTRNKEHAREIAHQKFQMFANQHLNLYEQQPQQTVLT
jgi:DNA-binding GntR family transcriptional regulator